METLDKNPSPYHRVGSFVLGMVEQDAIKTPALEATVENQEYDNGVAFRLRAHHIATLTPLVNRRIPIMPEKVASKLVNSLRHDLRFLGTIKSFDLLRTRPSFYDRKAWDAANAVYAYDVIGDTEEQAESFEAEYTQFMKNFLALDNSAIVELTSTKKDGVCHACTFQQHCDIETEFGEDELYLSVYEDIVHHFVTTDEHLELPERIDSSTILTTAGTLKRVMQFFSLGGFVGYSGLYSDAVKRVRETGAVFSEDSSPQVVEYMELYGEEIGLSD